MENYRYRVRVIAGEDACARQAEGQPLPAYSYRDFWVNSEAEARAFRKGVKAAEKDVELGTVISSVKIISKPSRLSGRAG